MKKLTCLLLALLFLCGCGRNKENIQMPVSFYYPNADISYNSDDAVLSAEIREGTEYKDDLCGLLNLYLVGPISDEFVSPFPTDTAVVSAVLADSTLTVELSESFTELKGLDLTLASACLAKTAIALTECVSVKLYVNGAKMDGNAYITLEANDLLLMDNVN